MDELDFFEKEDLKEVSKRTLIGVEYLIKLKNDDFEGIAKTKGLGFIKIIEREYSVDLSQKREKFLDYIKEIEKDKKQEYFIVPPKKSSNRLMKGIAIILLGLIAVGILYIIYINANIFDTNNSAYKSNQVVNETKQIAGIDINDSNIRDENISTDDTLQNESTTNTNVMEANDSIEENDTAAIESNTTVKKEKGLMATKKSITVMPSMEQNLSQKETNATKNTEETKHFIVIVPKNRIWVGVVNLKDYKKKSFIKDTNITIDTTSGALIATGHGQFKLIDGNKTYDFSGKNPIRFYVKDNNISQINRKEFIKMNRGKYW